MRKTNDRVRAEYENQFNLGIINSMPDEDEIYEIAAKEDKRLIDAINNQKEADILNQARLDSKQNKDVIIGIKKEVIKLINTKKIGDIRIRMHDEHTVIEIDIPTV